MARPLQFPFGVDAGSSLAQPGVTIDSRQPPFRRKENCVNVVVVDSRYRISILSEIRPIGCDSAREKAWQKNECLV